MTSKTTNKFSPEDRARANKSEQGTLNVACDIVDGKMELRIGDDGRGLALHKLYEKGLSNGVFAPGIPPSPQQVADLVFDSGVSTADKVTQVSGRGVGMDAVRVFLKDQGAAVRIALKSSTQDLGFALRETNRVIEPRCWGRVRRDLRRRP